MNLSAAPGRIAVYYQNTFSRNFTPGYLQKQDTADTIFNGDFETANLSQWTSNVNDGGNLSASDLADYWGLQGLNAVVNDNNAIYVQDDTPNNETQYRTRFYLNPNNITMATGDILDLFIGRNATGTDVLRIQMQKSATGYQIRSGLLNDAGTWTDTSWYDVPNAWSAVEIQYQAFANSGSLTLWLDDVQKQSLTFIDNDTRTITDVRLGAQGVETGTRGTLYFDDFESRRFSYIGTLTDPGVNDPQATNAPGWFARTYTYSASIPHAVTNVTPETGTPDTYSYDANGNMTCRVESGLTFKQTYNAENRISTIQKLASGTCASPGNLTSKWDFTYDGDGTRTGTLYTPYVSGQPQTSVLTAYYMGGAYEVTGSAVKKYYSIAGMMVAVNDGTALQYLLTDHLGSTVAVTNANGTLTSQQRYLPFGAPRTITNSPIAGTDFTYTGQRKLDDGMGGIMDYKARFYSPALGRFIQPDSIISNPTNPQSFNRFSYVVNNPIRFNDPNGHVCEDPEKEGAVCFGSPGVQTRVGDRMVRGNGAELGKAKNLPRSTKLKPLVKPWEYEADIDIGLHIGPASDSNNPDYYGETENSSANIPYIPGISSPHAPNLCAGGGAAAAGCLISLLTSFPFAHGPTNTNPNFFLSFDVNYNEATGITISTMQWSNQYQGQAVFRSLAINDSVVHFGDSYMPAGGYYPIPGSGGAHRGDDRITISGIIFSTINTPNGPGALPHNINVVLPSLPELKNFMQSISP